MHSDPEVTRFVPAFTTAGLGLSGALDPGAGAAAVVRPVVTALGLTSALLFATVRRAKKLHRPDP